MTTWISRAAGLALLTAALAGCDAKPMAFMANMPSFGKKAKAPLTTAPLARGAVMLVAPDGYCIDPAALTSNFAMLARCDALGAENSATTMPFALIAVSVAPMAADAKLPTAVELAAGKGLEQPSKPIEEDGYVIFPANGAPAATGLAGSHWRGATIVNGHMVGVALFRGADSPRISSEGAAIIESMIKKTQSAN